MNVNEYKRAVATWSGGIDSTGVVANLLKDGWIVHAVSLDFGPGQFVIREREARTALLPDLSDLARTCGGQFHYYDELDGSFLWQFSPDGVEIPTRNKRILDYLIAAWCTPRSIRNIAMGEYIGCDTWVVRDHVGAEDCDARSLGSYVYTQYGMDWRLVTLADFGPSRFKADRLRLLIDAVGLDAAGKTTNCLNNYPRHCGRCYKCLERAAAFSALNVDDPTDYMRPPREHSHYSTYLAQQRGDVAPVSVRAME